MPRRRDEGPHRRCIVTRAERDPDEMIRFVAAPDGTIVPDLRRKLPGRGVWVGASRALVAEAVRRKAFARGLKAQVTVPATLADDVEELLRRDSVQALALANKAGLVVTGFGKVEEAAAAGRVRAVIHAAEAAADGRRKIAQALFRGFGARAAEVDVVEVFAGHDLDLALGRSHVIHAALIAGPGSEGFLARWRRLARYRNGEGGTPPGDEAPGVPHERDLDKHVGAGFEPNE